MKLDILAFGVVREIFNNDSTIVELPEQPTLLDMRMLIEESYPALKRLGSYMISVNKEYIRDEGFKIFSGDEIAIIPPVSGG